ncbi:MAG: hypothetical protein IPH06_04830 [Alphaproteobacteria bacterium]|nr:hypothetical protein [Alphaproteobacteria bacterium]
MRLPSVFALFFGQRRIKGENLAAQGHHPRQQGARKISGVIGQGLPYLRIVGIGFQGLQIFLEGGLEKIVLQSPAYRFLRGLLLQALRLLQMGIGGVPRISPQDQQDSQKGKEKSQNRAGSEQNTSDSVPVDAYHVTSRAGLRAGILSAGGQTCGHDSVWVWEKKQVFAFIKP